MGQELGMKDESQEQEHHAGAGCLRAPARCSAPGFHPSSFIPHPSSLILSELLARFKQPLHLIDRSCFGVDTQHWLGS